MPTKVIASIPQQSPQTSYDANNNNLYTVETFSGITTEITPSFHISDPEWNITWSIDIEAPEYSYFKIYVYREDMSPILVKIISASNNITNDTASIHEGGYDYYIKIIAANLQSWNIVIEQNFTKTSLSPVQITSINYKGTIYKKDEENCIYYERIEPDEYVVIKNTGDNWEDIRGWVLKVESKDYITFKFPDYFTCYPLYFEDYHPNEHPVYPPLPLILGPHQSVLIYTDEFIAETGGLSFNYIHGDIWDNEIPNSAILYNTDGEEVSRKSYTIRPDKEPTSPILIKSVHYKGAKQSPETEETNNQYKNIEPDEYVSIKNTGNCFQDMSKWLLKNNNKEYAVFTFPLGFYLCPYETIRVYTDEGHHEWEGQCLRLRASELISIHTENSHSGNNNPCEFFPNDSFIPTGIISFQYSTGDLWNNYKPDTAILYDAKNNEISRKSYSLY